MQGAKAFNMKKYTSFKDNGTGKKAINSESHFWFRKELIKSLQWADLSTASKAVYPVIGIHSYSGRECYPSHKRIGAMGGISEKTVRNGVHGLKDVETFSFRPYVTSRGRKSFRYKMLPPDPDVKGNSFPFHSCIMDAGYWSILTPTAKALYPVMRCFSYVDREEEFDYEQPGSEIECYDDFSEGFKHRNYEFCNADFDVLAEYSGFTRKSLESALNSLIEGQMILYLNAEENLWRVYLRPIPFTSIS